MFNALRLWLSNLVQDLSFQIRLWWFDRNLDKQIRRTQQDNDQS